MTVTKTRTRRFSACHRHPSEPVTGFCALCLRDRLSGLDSSSSGQTVSPAPVPELRRSKSVVGERRDLVMDPRRKSCDVRGRNSLSELFTQNDEIGEMTNLGFPEIAEEMEMEELGNVKTMKEYIEIEIEKRKNRRSIFEETASVLSRKLRKWRVKDKEKNKLKLGELGEYGIGRRSCDTEPRFSIEDSRFSFDEHRVSWDGYMSARTMPNNVMSENVQMHSISEDGVSSGGSGQSNSAGSSWSSVKSSSTKTDDVKCGAANARVSPANEVVFQGTKLVITEKELKDWRLSSIKNSNVERVPTEAVSSGKTNVLNVPNGQKKVVSSRWKKVCNLWSNKKNVVETLENRTEKGSSSANVVRNPRIKRDEFALDRNRSTRYSTSDIDSGLLRLYLTPFRSTRRGKSGKTRCPLMPTNGLHLN